MTTFPTVRAVAKNAGTDRVLVNGVDVTWFRADSPGDTPIKVPGYTLTEPFAYGSSQPLVISRTNSLFEPYGTGSLAWLHKGARVQYQRVDDEGTVIATDYRGVVLAVRSSGREWIAEVAGEVSGRAQLIDVQPPLERKLHDLGRLMKFATRSLGLHFSEPTTGIEMPSIGGMTQMAVMQQYGAWSRTSASNQRALMPTSWGGSQWEWLPIDKTTVDSTCYADGSRIQLDLVDDLTEQPNTIFGSGVTPDGERWRNTKRPGIFQGEPDDYPIAGGAPFGVDTTDAETLDGFGISSMKIKLAWDSLLPDRFATGGTFDSHVEAAVNRLKDEAGLEQDGLMTPAAWDAMWNVGAVGFSTEGSRIFPLAQATRVRSYRYSPTGDILGRNPDKQAGAVRVDRTIPFGICEKPMAAENARSIVHQTEGHQWAGTITLNGVSLFAGEHGAEDAADLTADDLMPARDIRPGMNVWLPYFDGGTLVHVSMVDVNGTTVTLTVSTQGLDVFDLTQALERNAESKRNVYREWVATNRNIVPPGNFVTRDEDFGKLGQNRALRGGHWNIVEIPMGQSGSVSETFIKLTDTACEFCFAVFSKEIEATTLDGWFGSPFSVDDDGLSIWEHEDKNHFFEQRLLLTVQGQGSQPCGYSWKKGYFSDGTRTPNPLVGTHLDHASWSYVTDPKGQPVVYLAVYPREDCTLVRGRLFAALEDDAT